MSKSTKINLYPINDGFPNLKTNRKIKPMGNTSPWVWSIEPHYGCNLKCGHCCAGLVSSKRFHAMDKQTWEAAFTILNKVSPSVRVDLCGYVGEPTMNDNLLEFLSIARRIAPLTQIQITTNGVLLRKGKYTFKGLLDAGANIIYTDQYGTHEEFELLAKESGYPFFQYYNPEPGMPTPWKYYGPHVKMIVLMDPPEKWPQSRFRAGLLGNWYGNLDWERGKRFGMNPLLKPLHRRCNQPFLYVTVASNGSYLLCCQDGMQITNGMFGNVSSGLEGFHKFWYSKDMQIIRQRLREKNRVATPFACAKCNVTFSRCDFKHWTDAQVSQYYDGEWKKFIEVKIGGET